MKPSRSGMSLRCGDQIQRVLYPGIPIEALDGEEACSACACRAALANHPCPRCLVHHNQLDLIDEQFIPRTTETMREVYRASQTASTKTAAGDILKEYGLHATEVGRYFHHMFLKLFLMRVSRMHFGDSVIQIHTKHRPMILYILMMAANGENIYGHWLMTCYSNME